MPGVGSLIGLGSLIGISQGTSKKPVNGPLASLQSSQFDLSVLKYPDNVGTTDVPHYVIFNIYLPTTDPYVIENTVPTTNAQSQSQQSIDYTASPGGQQKQANVTSGGVGVVATISGAQAALQQFSEPGGGFLDSIGAAAGATAVSLASAGAISALSDTISFKPKLKQLKTSIAIYMPDTVMTSFNHDYGAVSATEALGKLGLASAVGADITSSNMLKGLPHSFEGWKNGILDGGVFKQAINNLRASDAGSEVAGMLSEASGLVGPGYTDLLLKSSGVAINPQVELIYRGTQNRSFIFEFRFQPRSQAEASAIMDIFHTFKMYSSPALNKTGLGRYFVVPGQFDITFKFQNVTNKYISQINTCVLESIDINYSGAGQFATMTDGMPAEITLQLRFKEGTIITRDLIAENTGY